ncbi:hypothetical protein HZS61_011747 [Fusarium oxysporum f. sp. conglutinans]|uniref:Alginate lyase domain-containing protein n=1 Tax=Fusarium oxysporum f. sp. conglutinans TaxID=100902 RepID=A0A8H6LKS0_FUSOX|nr:hypothetical protein HZS61_011747 [Fusarium oxysporum f. sp. conglutinans]
MKVSSGVHACLLGVLTQHVAQSWALSGEAKAMVEDSMEWMDRFYDPKISQLYDLDSKAAMNHETLASTWYAVGLLARNGDGDASRAEDVIRYVIKDQHDNPKGLVESLKTFDGERTYNGKAYYPPYDLDTRNITTWLSESLMIGAQSYRTRSANGPSNNKAQFHPAVAHWAYGDDNIGWLSLRPTEAHVLMEVSPKKLKVTYPEGTSSSVFTFVASPSLAKRDVQSWADIQGISISVSGNANPVPKVHIRWPIWWFGKSNLRPQLLEFGPHNACWI